MIAWKVVVIRDTQLDQIWLWGNSTRNCNTFFITVLMKRQD